MLGPTTLPCLSFSKWKRKVIRGGSYAQSSCFSFNEINPRTKHLINKIHWSSSRSGEIWNEHQSPQSTRLQGCPGAGIPFALLSGKPSILIFSNKLQPICLSFSHLVVFALLVSNCVCTRGLFSFMCSFGDQLDRPVWRKPYFGWCINNQGLFKVLLLFENWDTKFGQIEFSQGPHIQGYILLKMYKNWYNSWTKFSKALSDHTSLILIFQ